MGKSCSKSMPGCGKPATKTQTPKTQAEIDSLIFEKTKLGALPPSAGGTYYTGNHFPDTVKRRAAALVLGTVLGFGALVVSLGSYGFEMPAMSVRDARPAAVHQGETSTSGGAKKQERQVKTD